MVNVVLTADFDLDEDDPRLLGEILEEVVSAIAARNDGAEPSVGLTVDGEHRDPDDPATDLFS